MLPGYAPGKQIAAQRATVGQATVAAAPSASLSDPLGLLREFMESGEGKKWVLWIVLSAGVLAVAWMALRLLRDLGRGGK